MANSKLTNEELCSALLLHGSIKASAQELNVSERTIYSMMRKKDFIEIFEHSQADILNNTVIMFQDKISEAVQCIVEIMEDKDVAPQTRLQASQAILKNAESVFDRMERLRNKAMNENQSVFDLM